MAANQSNDEVLKRLHHNTLEKKRKDKINLGIKFLRDVLPKLNKKESAGETLNRAAVALQKYQEITNKHKQQEIEIFENIHKLEEELITEKKECESYRELLKISDRIPPETMTIAVQTEPVEAIVPLVISKPMTPLSMQSDPTTPATPVSVMPATAQASTLQLPMQQLIIPNNAPANKNVKMAGQNQVLIPVNQKGCRIALQNGQLVLINDNTPQIAPQPVINTLQQLPTNQQPTILPAPSLLNNNNNNNIILKNNSVTTPLFTEDANSTMKPSMPSQSIRIATPTGTLTMNTRPQQPNQMPSALVLPSGQIIPVVTRPQAMYPRQCLSNSIYVSGVSSGLTSTTVTASTQIKQLPSTMSAMINNEGNIILSMPDKNSKLLRKVVPKQSKEDILDTFTNDLLAQATESIFSSVPPTSQVNTMSYRNTTNDDNPLHIVEVPSTSSSQSPTKNSPTINAKSMATMDDTDISDFSDLIRIPSSKPEEINRPEEKKDTSNNGESFTLPSTEEPQTNNLPKKSPTISTISPEHQKYTAKEPERNNLSMPSFETNLTPKMFRKRKKEYSESPELNFNCDEDDDGSLSDTITFNDSETDLSRVLDHVEQLSPFPNTLNTPSSKRQCFQSKETEKKRIRLQESVFGVTASQASENSSWLSLFDSPEKGSKDKMKQKKPEIKTSPIKKDKKISKPKNQNSFEKIASPKKNKKSNEEKNNFNKDYNIIDNEIKSMKKVDDSSQNSFMDVICKSENSRDVCQIKEYPTKKTPQLHNNSCSIETSPIKELIISEESPDKSSRESLQFDFQPNLEPTVISSHEICKTQSVEINTIRSDNNLQSTNCSNNFLQNTVSVCEQELHKTQSILNHGSPIENTSQNIPPPVLCHSDLSKHELSTSNASNSSQNKSLKSEPMSYVNPHISQTVENVTANNPFSNDEENNAKTQSYIFDQPVWSKPNDSALKFNSPIGPAYCSNSELTPFSFSLTSNSNTSVNSPSISQTDNTPASRLPFYSNETIRTSTPLNLQRHYPDYAGGNKQPAIFPPNSFSNTPWMTGITAPPLVTTPSLSHSFQHQSATVKQIDTFEPPSNVTPTTSISYPLQRNSTVSPNIPSGYGMQQKSNATNPCYLNKLANNAQQYIRPSITPEYQHQQQQQQHHPPPPQQQPQQRTTPSPISGYHPKHTSPAYPAQKTNPSPIISGYHQRPSPISTPVANPPNMGPPGPYFNSVGLPAGGLLEKSSSQPSNPIPQRSPYMDVYPSADAFSYMNEQEKRNLYKLPQSVLQPNAGPPPPLSSIPLNKSAIVSLPQPVKRTSSKKSKSKKKCEVDQRSHFISTDTKTSNNLQKDQRPTYLGGNYISALPPNASKHVEPPIHASFNGQFQHQPPHLHGMIGNSQMVTPSINHAAYANFPALFPDISNNPLNSMSPPALKHPGGASHIRHQQVAPSPSYPPSASFHATPTGYPPFYPPGGCFPSADMTRFTTPHHHSTHPTFAHFPTLHDH